MHTNCNDFKAIIVHKLLEMYAHQQIEVVQNFIDGGLEILNNVVLIKLIVDVRVGGLKGDLLMLNGAIESVQKNM